MSESKPPAYTLYPLPGFFKKPDTRTEPVMAQVLEAYYVPYHIVNDSVQAIRLSRGHANPAGSGCVALNNQTGQAFYDFLEFCKDVKENQSLPCVNINL